MPPSIPTQRLDVEDNDQREARLSQLFQRINDSSSATSGTGTHADNNSRNSVSPSSITPLVVHPGPSSSASLSLFDFGVRETETHPVEPPSELLSRVEAFLPQMEAANADLARRMEVSPESVDIENLEGDEDGRQHIEMNLGLGVFDIRGRPISDPSYRPSTTSSLSDSDTDTDSTLDSYSSSDNDDSDSDPDASSSVPPASRPIRPLPKRARPKIVVLTESTSEAPDNADQ